MYEKITALYCRYSRDDGQEEENASITHQCELLKEYAENNGYTNLRYYADDGYSGTNFDRPDFQRMLEDIENGRTPRGYTWHHSEEPGKMQLVKTEDHDRRIGGAAHTGGNSIWGNKSVDNSNQNNDDIYKDILKSIKE